MKYGGPIYGAGWRAQQQHQQGDPIIYWKVRQALVSLETTSEGFPPECEQGFSRSAVINGKPVCLCVCMWSSCLRLFYDSIHEHGSAMQRLLSSCTVKNAL